MTLIEWTNAMSVHDSSMDIKHREIVEIVNTLYLDVRNARPPQVIEGHLGALAEIVSRHFAHEEGLMKETAYSRLDEHRRAHASMTQRTYEFLARYRQGEATMTMNQMQFLKAWLCTHIQDADHHFGQHLATLGNPAVQRLGTGQRVLR